MVGRCSSTHDLGDELPHKLVLLIRLRGAAAACKQRGEGGSHVYYLASCMQWQTAAVTGRPHACSWRKLQCNAESAHHLCACRMSAGPCKNEEGNKVCEEGPARISRSAA